MVWILISQSVMQDDWSGGPGVCGPVTGSFGTSYCSGTDVETSYPGLVRPSVVSTTPTWVERNLHPSISGHDNTGIEIVDFDGDGDMDIVASDEDYTRKLHILYNDGCATSFADSVVDDASGVGRGFEGVVVYDFDGNGYLDIFTGGEYYPNSSWYGQTVVYMGGPSGFSRQNWYLGQEPEDIANPTDLLNNGYVGTVITGHNSPLIYYYHDGTSWNSYTITSDIGDVVLDMAAHDMDGDGDDDVLLTLDGSQGLVIYRNDGGGTFTRVVIDGTLANGWKYMDVEDVDGDGDYDIAMTNRGSGRVYIYYNNGGLNFTRTTLDNALTSPIGVDIADMDLNGLPDVVVADPGSNKMYFYVQIPISPYWIKIPSSSSRPYFAAYIKDLDGDGYPDILTKTWNTAPGLWLYKTSPKFKPTAELVSSVYEDTYQRRWLSVEVRFTPCNNTLSGKRVDVYVRASRDGTTWTPWDGPYTFTSNGTLPLTGPFTSNTYKFLQYRLVLYSSTDSLTAPVVDYVRFNYDPLGSEDDLSTGESGDHGIGSGGRITVYSVSGEVVYRGRKVPPLPGGVYFVVEEGGKVHRVVVR